MKKQETNKFELLVKEERLPLSEVANIFKEKGFQIEYHKDTIKLKTPKSPTFSIKYLKGNYSLWVNEVDTTGKKTQKKLKQFQAKYEVSFDNIYEVLQEYTTLSIIQQILLNKIGGIIHLNWNGETIE